MWREVDYFIMIYFEFIYLTVALVFVFLQGPQYYNWHGFQKPAKLNIKEILLNTLGSIIGWAVGYFFIFHRIIFLYNNFNPSLGDLVLFLVAFYGMTGYLPHMLIEKLKLGK